MSIAPDQIHASFSLGYPDVMAVVPVAEDRLVQLGRGEMLCNARSILGPDASILALRKPPLCVGGAVLLPDRIGFILPTGWDGEFRIDGQQITPTSVYLIDSPNGFVSRGTNSHFYGVTIEREAFRATAAALLGIDPEDLVIQGGFFDLPLTAKARLAAQCERLLQGVSGAAADGAARDAYMARLQEVILEIYLAANPDMARTSSTFASATRIVRRAEECFAAAADATVSLADLCKATGTSSSTLYRVFSETVGMPPLRYFRMRRLNAVHDQLRRSPPERGLVTRLAMEQGFTELGRFSVEYRQVFGISPSTMLGQGRRDTDVMRRTEPAGCLT